MEQKLSLAERRKLALLRVISFAAVMCVLLLSAMTAAVFRGMGRLTELADGAETLAADLTLVTAELALVDWDALAQSVQEAAGAASEGMEQAAETLAAMDFAAVNEAVTALSEAVGPIAEFAKRFE